MAKPPAFLLYATDWLASTMTMSLEAQGAYIRLLCWQWDKGGLPADVRQLRQFCRNSFPENVTKWRHDSAYWAHIWRQLSAKFPVDSDGLRRNHKLEKVRVEMAAFKARRSNGGKGRAATAERDEQGKFRLHGSDQGSPAGDQPPSPVRTYDPNVRSTSQVPASSRDVPVPREVQRPDGRDTDTGIGHTPEGEEDERRIELTRAPADDGNYRVMVRLAHDVMDKCHIGDPTSPDLTDLFKTACAQKGITYESEVFHRALRSAATQRVLGRPMVDDRRGPLSPLATQLKAALDAGALPQTVGKMLRARLR
jgi:uncharacterized protein YdaU (DUF1376 family)